MTKNVYEIDRNTLKTAGDFRNYAFKRSQQRLKEIEESEKEKEKIEDDDELGSYEKEQKLEELEEENEPLAIDWHYTLTIELSTGGDADGFILEFDKEKRLTGAKYYWADWGKYEEIELEGDEIDKVADFYLRGEPEIFLQ